MWCRQQLVCIVDRGLNRGRARNIPNSAAGSRFTHLCLRKMFVLCSRGAEASGAQLCLLEVQLPISSWEASVSAYSFSHCDACCIAGPAKLC